VYWLLVWYVIIVASYIVAVMGDPTLAQPF
jgi:hypothetical protein